MCLRFCWRCISLHSQLKESASHSFFTGRLPCEEARYTVSNHTVVQTVELLGEAGAAAVTVHGRTAEQRWLAVPFPAPA